MRQNKTKLLNELFIEWERHSESEYKGRFIKDGIIDETLFNQAKLKILFITKEANDPKQTSWDFREWWKKNIDYAFSYRLAEWSFGLLNDFPYYDKVWEKKGAAHEALKKVAFMNVKKSGGSGKSNFKTILNHIKNNFDFIHREIEIIEPDVIITGLSWQGLRDELFPNLEWVKSGYSVDIARFEQSKVIDFYHPSSRNAPAAAYSLLGNIINTEIFRSL